MPKDQCVTPELPALGDWRWVLLVISLALAVVLVYTVVPKLLDLFKVKGPELLTHPITTIAVLVALGFALHLLDFGFIAEGLLVAGTVGLLLEATHIREFFIEELKTTLAGFMHPDVDLSGKWTYTVTSEVIEHQGTCDIWQDKYKLSITGRRTHERGPDGNLTQMKCETTWGTVFTAVETHIIPKRLHFVYSILTANETIEGYCALYIADPNPADQKDADKVPITKLYGTYNQLGPHILQGNIRFTRTIEDALKDTKRKRDGLQEQGGKASLLCRLFARRDKGKNDGLLAAAPSEPLQRHEAKDEAPPNPISGNPPGPARLPDSENRV